MFISFFKKTILLLFAFLLLCTQSLVYAVDVEIEDLTPDLEAPQLNSINVSSQKLSPSLPVTISADISDKLSGVQNAIVYYKKPSGKTVSFYFEFNNKTQKYEASVSVGTIDEPGEWKVDSVQLYDKKGNGVSIERPLFDFTNVDLKVTGVTLPMESTDKKAPVLRDISIESNQVSSGQSIKVSAVVTDDQSGVNGVLVYYKKPSGKNFNIWLELNGSTGNFEGSQSINKYEELGDWEISTVYLTDQANNSTSVKSYKDKDDIVRNFDHCTVKITGTLSDLEAPSLDDLAIELNQVSTISARVKLTAKVNDELSGVSSVYGSYTKPSGRTAYIDFSRSDDTYVATMPIDKYDESGKWELKYITAIDNMDNSVTIYDRNEQKYFDVFDINVNKKITISPGIPFAIDLGIEGNNLSLKSEENYQLKPFLNYTDKNKREITTDSLTVYTSSNPALVTVSKTGLITIPEGAAPGYAVIGVSYGDIVKNVTVKVNGGSDNAFLKITPLTKTLSSGQQEQLRVTEIRSSITKNVTNSTSGIRYTSLTPSLASVSEDGLIKVAEGANNGTVLIKVKYGELEGEVKINITQPSVKSLVMTPSEENLSLTNNKLQLIVKAFMSDGTTKDVTKSAEGTKYTSSNPEIAQVSPDGFVTIPTNAKSGIVTISVVNSKLTIKSVLNVIGNPEFVGLNLDSIPAEISIGEKKQIILKSKWSDGTEKDLNIQDTKFTNSRTDRVNVSEDGQLQALSAGTSKIDIVYEGKSFSITVKVMPKPTLSKFYMELPIGSQMKVGESINISLLKAEWSNGNISDINVKDVLFSSSRPDRVAVTAEGKIIALTSGSANIDIKYEGKVISKTVKVEEGATLSDIYLETNLPTEMKIGDEHSIGRVNTIWSNGDNNVIDDMGISYTSSRPDRIKITDEGQLIAIASGSSNIEIKYKGKVINKMIKVESGPIMSGIYLEKSLPSEMKIGGEHSIGKIKAVWSNGDENVIDDIGLSYNSSRPDRIKITEEGKIVALSSGSANIEIKYEGKSIQFTIKVVAGPSLTSIYLEKSQFPVTMRIGETQPIGTVKAKWSNEEETILSNSNISFISSRPDRILVTDGGEGELELVALSIGTSNIDINYGGKTIRVSIKVIPY